MSTTITLITPAACNIPLMLKHFQRDYPIFCHYMILIFSRAIPQSMHRARLKLSSTLYRQLPKLAFKITILAWIWVVWLWNINNHANILKGFKIYLKVSHISVFLYFHSLPVLCNPTCARLMAEAFWWTPGVDVIEGVSVRVNRGFLVSYSVLYTKWEERRKAPQCWPRPAYANPK